MVLHDIDISCDLVISLTGKKLCSLAENTNSRIVFNEVLAAAGRDMVTKDVSRLRGGWPMQDAFYVSIFYTQMFKGYLLLIIWILSLTLDYVFECTYYGHFYYIAK